QGSVGVSKFAGDQRHRHGPVLAGGDLLHIPHSSGSWNAWQRCPPELFLGSDLEGGLEVCIVEELHDIDRGCAALLSGFSYHRQQRSCRELHFQVVLIEDLLIASQASSRTI